MGEQPLSRHTGDCLETSAPPRAATAQGHQAPPGPARSERAARDPQARNSCATGWRPWRRSPARGNGPRRCASLTCKTCWANTMMRSSPRGWLREAGVDSGEPECAFVAGRMAGACDQRRRSLERHVGRKLERAEPFLADCVAMHICSGTDGSGWVWSLRQSWARDPGSLPRAGGAPQMEPINGHWRCRPAVPRSTPGLTCSRSPRRDAGR